MSNRVEHPVCISARRDVAGKHLICSPCWRAGFSVWVAGGRGDEACERARKGVGCIGWVCEEYLVPARHFFSSRTATKKNKKNSKARPDGKKWKH